MADAGDGAMSKFYTEDHYEHQSNDPIEDTHEIHYGEDFIYAGVYDGHGGYTTSHFLRKEAYKEFHQQLRATKDPEQAFKRAWVSLDEKYIRQCIKNPRKVGLFAGSCSLAAYIDFNEMTMWIANLGDSRAVLGNITDGGWVDTVELTTDHSAGTGKERHRVKEEHPHDSTCVKEEWDEFLQIYVFLVKNICMFTRSIGDAYMKSKEAAELYNPRMDPNHKVLPLPSPGRTYISNIAEVTVRAIQPGDAFVIVACDGLWDELSNHEAVTRAADFLKKNPGQTTGCAEYLVNYALDKAALRLLKQEPELNVRTRHDLLKIPPGRDGRKYLHDDITVSVIVFSSASQDIADAAGAVAGGAKKSAKGRWGDIKRSVDLIKAMKGKNAASMKWGSLIDNLKAEAAAAE